MIAMEYKKRGIFPKIETVVRLIDSKFLSRNGII